MHTDTAEVSRPPRKDQTMAPDTKFGKDKKTKITSE